MAKNPKGCTCVGPIHMEELDIPTAESTHSWSDLRGRPDELPHEECEACGLERVSDTLEGYTGDCNSTCEWKYLDSVTGDPILLKPCPNA